jgi:hypothetical protein
VIIFGHHFRPLFRSLDLQSPKSTFNQTAEGLQQKIWDQLSSEVGTDLEARLDFALMLSDISSRTGFLEQKIIDVIHELRATDNPVQKKAVIRKLLSATKTGRLSIDVRVVDELSSYLVSEAEARILQATENSARLKILKNVSEELSQSFKDSPYYYVLDAKIDSLLLKIKATREEALALGSIKTFQGADDAQSVFEATDLEVQKLNRTTWLLDAVAQTTKLRTAAENELFRRFLIEGEGNDTLRSREVRQMIAAQLVDLYSNESFQLDKILSTSSESKDIKKKGFQVSNEKAQNEAGLSRKRLEVLVEAELNALHERFRRLPPGHQILLSASFLRLPGLDSSILESGTFLDKAVGDFLVDEKRESQALHLLAKEFLKSFSPEQRALLIAKSEVENTSIVPSATDDVKRLRARRFSALGSALQPFGDKLIQILARNQAIDPVYREVFRIKEDRASTPPYDTLYEMLAPHLTAEEAASLDRISDVRAGSVKVTLIVDFKQPDGSISKKVFSIRRPSIERSVDIVYEKTRDALRAAQAQKGGEDFKPYLSVPDDAYSLVKAEMKFDEEFKRTQEAQKKYEAARTQTSDPARVRTVRPERLSQVGRDQQAIVFPYHEAIRLDQIKDHKISKQLAAEILRTELDLLLADEDQIVFDADRHQGNILVVEGEQGFEAIHIDFGQWVAVSRGSRDLFGRLIFALIQDTLSGGGGSFDQVAFHLWQASRGEGSQQSLNEFKASPFWKALLKDLQGLKPPSQTQSAQSAQAGQVVTALLYIKEAISKDLPADHPQKTVADDLFKLTKALETLGGMTHQHPELFQEVFMQEIAQKLGENGLMKLLAEPQAAVQQLFPRAASVSCELLLKSAANRLPRRSAAGKNGKD